MVSTRWLFATILAVQILYSLQQNKEGEAKEGEGDDFVTDSVKVECITEAQAQTISEEIAKMLQTATIVETSTSLFASVTSMPAIESCAEEISESANFKSKYGAKVQQFLAKAADAEQKIKDGNDLKEVSDKLSELLKNMWLTLKKNTRQQQKMLNALDIFAKDSVLQRAANMELDIKDKDSGKTWTLKDMKEGLKKELSQATDMMDTLSDSMKGLLSTVLTDIMDYFTTSQMFTSLRGTDLFKKMKKDFKYMNAFGYSEVAMSKCLWQVSKLRHATLVVGEDEATKYSKNINETLETLKEDVDSLNEINEQMTCKERYNIADRVYKSLNTIFLGVQDKTLRLARAYVDAVDNNAIAYMMPLTTEQAFESALRLLAFTSPESNPPPALKEATGQVLRFAVSVRRAKNVEDALKTAEKAFPHVSTLASATVCYAKIMDAVGTIRQRCSDGEGTFDDIFNEVENGLKFDQEKCQTVSGLTFPTKTEVKSMVEKAALKLGFSKECTRNKQQDQPSVRFAFYDENGVDDDDVNEILSPTQRYMVCDLRKKRKNTQSVIANLLDVNESKIRSVRCKAGK